MAFFFFDTDRAKKLKNLERVANFRGKKYKFHGSRTTRGCATFRCVVVVVMALGGAIARSLKKSGSGASLRICVRRAESAGRLASHSFPTLCFEDFPFKKKAPRYFEI